MAARSPSAAATATAASAGRAAALLRAPTPGPQLLAALAELPLRASLSGALRSLAAAAAHRGAAPAGRCADQPQVVESFEPCFV